jgi:WD40 repeat protein
MFIWAMSTANANATLASQNQAYGNTQSALRVTSDAFGNAQATLAFVQAALADQRSTQVAENAALAAAESTLSAERKEQAAVNARIALTALAQEATAVYNAGQALSRQLASQARSFLTRRPELGILLAVQSFRVDSSNWDARSVLLEGLRAGLDQSVVPYELNIPAGQEDTNNVNITSDGKLVIWSGAEGVITLWDVARRSARKLQDPEGTLITAQAVSPADPNLLITGNLNNQLLFWDLRDGSFERVRAVGTSSTGTRYNHGRIRRLEFNPDGDLLAIQGQTANIAIWDVDSHSERLSFKAQPDFYWDLDWSPDNRYLAAAGGDNYLYVFDPLTGNRLIRQANPDADGRVYNVDWSPDSKILAFAGASGTRFARVNFYDMANRVLLPDSLQSASSTIYALSYNDPRGDLIVAAGYNSPVEIWRLSDGSKYPPLATYGDYQNGLSFQNELLAYLGFETISVYELRDPQPLTTVLNPFAGNSQAVASYQPGELWLAGASGGSLLLEQRVGNQSQVVQPGAGFPAGSSAYDVVFSPDRTLYAIPQGLGELYHWDPASNTTDLVATDFPTTTSALVVSQDGVRMAAGSCKEQSIEQIGSLCSVQLFDLQTRTPVGQPISTTQSTITSLAFSPNGTALASGDQDGTIYLIDVNTGKLGEIPLGGFSEGFTSLAFSPDGSTLAAGTDQGNIFLWDVKSGQVLSKPFQFSNLPLTGLAFSPDGRLLYTAAQDGKTSAWDVDFNSWAQRACVLAGRSLDQVEWRQFMGDLEFNPACQEEPQSTATPTPTPSTTPTP